MWLHSRWTFLCLAVLGTALVGMAYYWNRRRTFVRAITKQFDEHVSKLETRGVEVNRDVEEKLTQIKEKQAELDKLRALQAVAAVAAVQDDDQDSGVWLSDGADADGSTGSDTSSERGVGELILAIRQVVNG